MGKVEHILGLAAILYVQWLTTRSGMFEAHAVPRTGWFDWISAMELIAPVCLGGLVIIIYFVTKRITKRKRSNNHENCSDHR